MAGVKTDFTATGTSAEFPVTGQSTALYYADFDTGSGAGTVQLQVKMGNDWIPADEEITASMSVAEVARGESTNTRLYRWNCSAYTSGTITTYLE